MFEGLFQPMHLLLIVIVLLLLFGPRKLPDLGKGLGDGIREFKNALKGDGANQAQNQTTSQSASQTQTEVKPEEVKK